jgi:hypothetical protein
MQEPTRSAEAPAEQPGWNPPLNSVATRRLYEIARTGCTLLLLAQARPIELGTVTNTRSSLSGCASVQIDELNPNDILRFTTAALDTFSCPPLRPFPDLQRQAGFSQPSTTCTSMTQICHSMAT